MLLRLAVATLLLALTHPAVAQPAATPDKTGAQLSYAVYAAGLNVTNFEVKTAFSPAAYRINLSFSTAGMFSLFLPAHIDSFAQGTWSGTRPAPVRYASWGTVRGKLRRVTIDYRDTQPVLLELEPRDDGDHLPVPPGQEQGGIDTLSGLAFLVRQIADTGNCDGEARLFDGRRVMQVVSRTAGRETLSAEGRSSFAGPALHCVLSGHLLAGFQRDDDAAERNRLHISEAWLAPVVPGHPPVPVRIIFEARFFGHATAYLTEAAALKAP